MVYLGLQNKKSASKEEATTAIQTETEISRENMMHSFLTGEWVDNSIGLRKPVAYMLDNVPNALPQTGISRAGVVYEAPVEGGICRLMPIMENYDDLQVITNMRSARTYYPYLAQEFESIFLHSGDTIYSLPITSSSTINNLKDDATPQSGYNGITFFRGSDRPSPHNLYTSGARINAGIEAKGYEKNHSADYSGKFLFAEDDDTIFLENGTPAVKIETGYQVDQSYFIYNSADGLYYRFQYGEPHIDALNSKQLTCSNIILQYCDYVNYDEHGYLNIDVNSSGSGKYITTGNAIDITWEKTSDFGVTHYYDSTGNEITLNQGKTWICIILDNRVNNVVISDSVE